MPGPKPTPTAQLANRGSWRAKKRPDEPTPEPVTECEAPTDLPERAREVWATMAPRLIGSGVLTVADLPAFSRYCRLYAAWEGAMRDVEEENADRGFVLTLAKLDELVRRLEQNFGLTPADRTGIRVDQPETTGKGRFFETRAA